MNTILVADIFGKTPALIQLGHALNTSVIVDPYSGENMVFNNETEAYTYFVEKVGFENYLMTLTKVVKSATSINSLIGFSIGAAAIWKLSENPAIKNIKRGICYYGSQIRNLKEVNPLFEVDLIFPKRESHFDADKLRTEVTGKQKVNIVQTPNLHGFMNPLSNNFNELAYHQQINWLQMRNSELNSSARG
jgi:dienelactone hydrolase